IAQKILERIIKDYSNKNYDYIEAYPRKEESSSETSFKGPLELYKRFDFKINKEYGDYFVMRKRMK
ncbi:MAG TPA: GNAT family N-acetyltransferase, partial [Candidatus Dojkabacteria bacterium]|nr:GNAT family N-acetyltransferase [Candidatus Dojkabacteria bacterium]